MRILIASRQFAPSIGGIETVVRLLAEEFKALGHEVRIVTSTPSSNDNYSFKVVRIKNEIELLTHVWWASVVIQPNISLKYIWPCFLLGKKVIITHQQWYLGKNGKIRLLDRLKRWLASYTKNIVISRSIGDHLGCPSVVVPNPYDHKQFYKDKEIERRTSVVCVARLVSDKGVDILLKAIKLLENSAPECSIIGDGPERIKLEKLSIDLGISRKVKFHGALQGSALRNELNHHNLIIIPSRHGEPFGIVALEGIACGCVAIGTEGGGLQEAIGNCGIIVPREDEKSLANAIKELLDNSEALIRYLKLANNHLEKHSSTEIAKRYLEIIQEVVR